jgi:hypothetical protein
MRENLKVILELRTLVGLLGERQHYGWWQTNFFDNAASGFLQPVFSKTSHLAQYHGVLEAARRLHDEHLSVGTYHLFRLPEEVEQDLHAIVHGSSGEEIARQAPQSKETALAALKPLAASSGTYNMGPTAIGSVKDLNSPNILRAIAAAYQSAFAQNINTFPYLVG